jgi:hypothetical protein
MTTVSQPERQSISLATARQRGTRPKGGGGQATDKLAANLRRLSRSLEEFERLRGHRAASGRDEAPTPNTATATRPRPSKSKRSKSTPSDVHFYLDVVDECFRQWADEAP